MSESIADRPVPPANPEAEQALLGAILINNHAYDAVSSTLLPDHFSHAVHGRIYEEIGKLISRGVVADAITLRAVFERNAALSGLGGTQYLLKLISAAVTVVNAKHYGQSIIDMAKRRALIAACQKAMDDAYSVDLDRPAEAIVEEHEQALYALAERAGNEAGPAPLRVAIDESLGQTEAAYKAGGQILGVETGLVDLDHLIGGLGRGNLEIIAGRPSMGKSSLSASIALHAAERLHVPSLIFSLEETRAQQAQRLLASWSGVASNLQRRGDLDMVGWQNLSRAASDLSPLPITIDDTPALSIGEIRRRARQLKRTKGIGLVVVDHLQLVTVPGRHERRIEVGIITRGLKQLAKELDLPVVCLSQLSRAVEQRENKRPVLADLKESGDVEQDADGVMFLYRAEYYLAREEPTQRPDETEEKFNDRHSRWQRTCDDAIGIAEIVVAKRRNGPIGTIKVRWDGSLTRFENLSRSF
ncbi:MAG: replicative DNA helicase [Alphaproteobacteria bacterium]